ncbi:MAG: methyltransferase domain-containing protein [Pseudomonadota bacterium]
MPMSTDNENLAAWFQTPLGGYLLDREQHYCDRMVADVFGFNAFQFGLPEYDFLRASRIALRCVVGRDGKAGLRADFRDLPIASNSADLVLLPHVLEFHVDPHQILREVQRIMMPEGQMIITGFNPWSLWGIPRLRKSARRHYPWCGQFINLSRLKDWLALLGFEIVAGRMCCYAPPFKQEKWLRRFAFMEKAGDRWWPVGGGVYFFQAVKRVRGMRVITPQWHERFAAKKNLSAIPQKAAQKEPITMKRP